MKTMAEELFKEFRGHSVSEFFRKSAAMLGCGTGILSVTSPPNQFKSLGERFS
jgi:DNA topoisomerase VI subunit B